GHAHSLRGASCRFLAASRHPCGRQRKTAGGNHLAAFLGYPDHSVRPDCYVLRDARTGAREWERKGAADILRPDAYPASLNEAPMAETKKNSWTIISIRDRPSTLLRSGFNSPARR